MAYYTTVYVVNDEAAFGAEWSHIHKLFGAGTDQPFAIVAVSHDHELRRVQLIEEARDRYDDHQEFRDAVDAILACGNLAAWRWADGRPEDIETIGFGPQTDCAI